MNQTYSLKHSDGIITVASWEQRFLIGLSKILEEIGPTSILMFYYEEYSDWSNENRQKIKDICRGKNIELNEKSLSFTAPEKSWKSLVDEVNSYVQKDELITLDITTMPRDAVWSICQILYAEGCKIQYTYLKPEKYGDWLSRDPGKPRIIYRQAGIQHLWRQTALLIQTGFDVERSKQLIRFFEPEKLLLGLQIGDQYGNNKENRQKHKNMFEKRRNVLIFDVDGYSFSDSYKVFNDKISRLISKYNIIISSLGPKIGALSLCQIKRNYPDVAICYAPSREFNREYSSGTGECIQGLLCVD